jgi:hypothetical protein
MFASGLGAGHGSRPRRSGNCSGLAVLRNLNSCYLALNLSHVCISHTIAQDSGKSNRPGDNWNDLRVWSVNAETTEVCRWRTRFTTIDITNSHIYPPIQHLACWKSVWRPEIEPSDAVIVEILGSNIDVEKWIDMTAEWATNMNGLWSVLSKARNDGIAPHAHNIQLVTNWMTGGGRSVGPDSRRRSPDQCTSSHRYFKSERLEWMASRTWRRCWWIGCFERAHELWLAITLTRYRTLRYECCGEQVGQLISNITVNRKEMCTSVEKKCLPLHRSAILQSRVGLYSEPPRALLDLVITELI